MSQEEQTEKEFASVTQQYTIGLAKNNPEIETNFKANIFS